MTQHSGGRLLAGSRLCRLPERPVLAESCVEIGRLTVNWLLSDKLYFGGRHPSRRTHVLIEFFCIACAVVVFAASFAIAEEARAAVRVCAFLALFCAFLISLQNRAFDRYGLWAGSENTPPERRRTWRGKAVEYTIVLGVGILGLVVVAFLAV